MPGKRLFSISLIITIGILMSLFVSAAGAGNGPQLSDLEILGKAIYFDQNLSINRNQACAACHDPDWGWTGPDSATNAGGAVYEGSIAGRFGNRKPPSAAYATVSPILYLDKSGLWVGGNFWDGRATGEKLGNPAADQAQGPFLNPAEQALPDSACVVYRVCNAQNYPVSFEQVWGDTACDIDWPQNTDKMCEIEGKVIKLSLQDRYKSDQAYDNIALSIAAFEGSYEVNAFTSKYDYSLKGMAKLTKEEQLGYAIFQGKGKCKLCHLSSGQQPLFTDFTYDNLGVPKNPQNPVYTYDPDFIDTGLGGYLKSLGYSEAVYMAEWGKVKVPTLRNVDLRPNDGSIKAYAHNGYFKSLDDIVHFYNTRDVLPYCEDLSDPQEGENCWPMPEVSDNVNTAELGNLGLTVREEKALVTFLKTLSDGYQP